MRWAASGSSANARASLRWRDDEGDTNGTKQQRFGAGIDSRAPGATEPVTEATLAAFSEAWNRHDADALMSFMHDDCVFQAAVGPEACGARHAGREAVKQAFAAAWATVPDARWENGRHTVQGDFGVSQWTFTGTAADGSRIETDGVDVFTFKDGKILVKNAFRKNRPNLPAKGAAAKP